MSLVVLLEEIGISPSALCQEDRCLDSLIVKGLLRPLIRISIADNLKSQEELTFLDLD